jgi:hypothetical protein
MSVIANVLVAVERSPPSRRGRNVHVFTIFCDGKACDWDPSVAKCLANPAVAEGLEFYHFPHVKLYYGCGINWTTINFFGSARDDA